MAGDSDVSGAPSGTNTPKSTLPGEGDEGLVEKKMKSSLLRTLRDKLAGHELAEAQSQASQMHGAAVTGVATGPVVGAPTQGGSRDAEMLLAKAEY